MLASTQFQETNRQKPLKRHLLYVSAAKPSLAKAKCPPQPECTAYNNKILPAACNTAECPQSSRNCLFPPRCRSASSSANAPQAALILSIITGVALQLFWGLSGPRRAGKNRARLRLPRLRDTDPTRSGDGEQFHLE